MVVFLISKLAEEHIGGRIFGKTRGQLLVDLHRLEFQADAAIQDLRSFGIEARK